MRKFERISLFSSPRGMFFAQLPERKTKFSAGYDFFALRDVKLPPNMTTLIPTGVKAYMEKDEYLQIAIRSSLAIKHDLSLANGIGIIDADYVDNSDNEGHIMIAVRNNSDKEFFINAGDRIAQGIFLKYYKTADDITDEIREGGMGSTGK